MNCLVPVVIRCIHSAGARGRDTSRPRTLITGLIACSCALFAAMTADAQFKVVGPPPFSATVARQKIRTSLENVDPGNRQQTIETLSGLLSWYRDILDEELIAAWQKDTRASLPEVLEALADSRVASAIVEFSWREQRAAAFRLSYAPMFGNLMTRFPESAQPFLDDLLGPAAKGQPMPNLSQPEAETVCRILLDMPDVGTWRKSALEILPHYRQAAENLLVQDLHGSDRDKSFQAQRWLTDLKMDAPSTAGEQRNPRRRAVSPEFPVSDQPATRNQTAPVAVPRPEREPAPAPAATNSRPAHAPLPPAPVTSAPLAYNGPKSGTVECSGSPIPQNAEYVFRNLPPVKMQLDYDTKTWDARLAPGEGETQKLIVRNKSSGPQKRCVVHWSVIP
jgi:hypothetical protein